MFLMFFATTSAFAGSLKITADTDYKNTVWTGVELGRLYSANILPANPEAAAALGKLDARKEYTCTSDYYLGSIGNFNSGNEKGVIMLYSLSGCKATR
ncbi:MAG TPA: hypothetical protein DCS07_16970 [Bdellovibrionales bacterium]|nr:MAG: hypothetical protein A2Z97_12430 [Bdellovibrionales bacterium GWB1_52_6]HAR44294.1 hypothetical protein [Bdellovibrionales bacterium]